MIGTLSKNFFTKIPNNTFAKILSHKYPKFTIIPSNFINKNDYYQFIIIDNTTISCKFNEDFYLNKYKYFESYKINIMMPHNDYYIVESMYYNEKTYPDWHYSLDVSSYKYIVMNENDKKLIVKDFQNKLNDFLS